MRYVESQVFRLPSSAVAYLQAPPGWRQRVRLTVLVREDHPPSAVLARAPREESPRAPVAARLPQLPSGSDLDQLLVNLRVLARSGMPVVIEKCIADRINLDLLSPRVVGPNGVQVLQRQTLRVCTTLPVLLRAHPRAPRGSPCPPPV